MFSVRVCLCSVRVCGIKQCSESITCLSRLSLAMVHIKEREKIEKDQRREKDEKREKNQLSKLEL